jgi:hypothetical protein
VLAIGGVVLRYGQFYGPGTFFEHTLPPPPRVRIDRAAAESVAALAEARAGVRVIVEEAAD